MKNTNLILGITGLVLTLLIHIFLSIFSNVNFTYMFTFYIVWIAFLAIGIGQAIKNKPTNA